MYATADAFCLTRLRVVRCAATMPAQTYTSTPARNSGRNAAPMRPASPPPATKAPTGRECRLMPGKT